MNSLQEKYPKEIKDILEKYPTEEKRAAVMPLIYLAQREAGFVKKQDLFDIAEVIGSTATEIASIVGFYTLFHDKPGGKYRIQVCDDVSCAMRGADDFIEKLCEIIGIRLGETTEDGLVSVEAVKCLAGCDKGPVFQVQSEDGIIYYENQTLESAMQLIEEWRKKEGGEK